MRSLACWILTTIVVLGAVSFSACSEEDVLYGNAVGALNEAAKTSVNRGNAKQAVAYLESAVVLKPAETSTLYNLAVAYQSNSQYDKAVETFNQLIKLQPDDTAKLYQYRAMALEEKADTLRADLNDALDTLESSVPACTTRSKRQEMEGDVEQLHQKAEASYQQAIEGYQAALTYEPDNAEALQQQVSQLEDALEKLNKEAS